MTLKQSKRLLARQVGKVTIKQLLTLKQRRMNPTLMRKMFVISSDTAVLSSLTNYFGELILKGDKQALKFITRTCSEKINKNSFSRRYALMTLDGLLNKENFSGIRGFFIGLRDSDPVNRAIALNGLFTLAKFGKARTLPGLVKGTKDSDEHCRDIAWRGIKDLATQKNPNALKLMINHIAYWKG